jgi:hypothetical protein
MARTRNCNAIKANGERCRGVAIERSDWCYQHDPARSEERRRNASLGGKSGGRGRRSETSEIKVELAYLTTKVLAGEIETPKVAVANQLINTRLRAVELERKVRETDELEARLRELEESITRQTGGRKWGA